MDFVPEASSAAYQCYVSESDTDGEGDGSKRRSSTNTNPQRRPWSKFQGIGAFSLASTKVNGDEYHECSASKSAAEAVQHQEQQHGSILAKFSSWSISSRWEKASPAGAGQRREGPHGGSALRKCAQKGEAGKLSGSENARGRHSTTTHALSLKGSLLPGNSSPSKSALAGAETVGRRGSSRAHGGGSSDRRGEEPEGLWDEASKGQLDALAAALAPGGNGNVHATTMGGWTALHSAAEAGKSAAVALLLKNGASAAARARHGWTPLHLACMRGKSHAAKVLLAGGADANTRSRDQRTALHFACEAGSPECVRELLLAGATANVSDQDARTPLHFACIDGSTECVRRLLRAGASPLPPDAWGRDPAAVARQLGREGPLRLLEVATTKGSGGGLSRRASLLALTSSTPDDRQCEGPCDAQHEESAQTPKPQLKGDRWVVMSEGGRMLERASGKVAVFRSMAAAADWANGLEIKSGSFQVAEVTSTMREAFEREVNYELTGGGTLSEEDDEEEKDPQWTRYRRQRAAAVAAAAVSASASARGGQARKRRSSWATSIQRREEDEERAMVELAAEKLRQLTEERDLHREKAVSLEKALEAVLKDCKAAAEAAAAASEASSANAVAAKAVGATAAEVSVEEANAASTVTEKHIPDTFAHLIGAVEVVASGDVSESETDGEVDEEDEETVEEEHGITNGKDENVGSTTAQIKMVTTNDHGAKSGELGGISCGCANAFAVDTKQCGDNILNTRDADSPIRADSDRSEAVVDASEALTRRAEEEDGGQDSEDDEATQQKLTSWLCRLQIRRPDAERYSRQLIADGFDSGEALRGVREEELMHFGMKKGHARLVVRKLAEGLNLESEA